jgi:hypothetical protein
MAAHLKIYFRNGINGTPEDWTPYFSSMNNIKKKVESDKEGEAGVIVFDKVTLVMEYKSGSPVYSAFNRDLTSIQRYIIEVYGLKSNKTEPQQFTGVIDFNSLNWPDGECKISFDVLDKLSAIDLLQTTRKQRADLADAIHARAGFSGSYGIGISKRTLSGIGDCYVLPTWTVKYVNNTATRDQQFAHNNLVLEKGDILLHPDIGYYDGDNVFHPGPGKFLVIDSGFTTYNEIQTTWIKVHEPSENFEFNPATWENFMPHLSFHSKGYYDKTDICTYGYDSYGRNIVQGFNSVRMVEAIYGVIWGDTSTGANDFAIALSYYLQTIDENPFEKHPLDALKELADSMQCYIFTNRLGELKIQLKEEDSLGTNGTTRTLSSSLYKNAGTKEYSWNKLCDDIQITVNSWVKDDQGNYLQGYSSLKKNTNIKSRNPLKKVVLASSSETNTQEALNSYASTMASNYYNFYCNRHWAYSLDLKIYDAMLDWDLLDNITIGGILYFFSSLSINLMKRTLSAELVSVQSYNYDFSQAHIVLNDSNESDYYSSGSTSGGGTGGSATLNPVLTALSALDTARGIIVQTNDTFFNKRKIKSTVNEIRIVDLNNAANEDGATDDFYPRLQEDVKIINSLAIGGAVDTNYKIKVYGNQKVTGDLTVDGNIYLNGNINQVNVNDLNVVDHAIRFNKGGDNTTALSGGIEMLGASDALLGSIKYEGNRWLSDLDLDVASGKVYKINNVEVLSSTTLGAAVVNSSLTSIGTLNHDLNIASGKVYKINSGSVLSSTTLGSTVVNSSLTSIGTIGTGVWQGTTIKAPYIAYNSTNLKNDGSTTFALNTIQDIATTSSPQFTNQTLTGTLDQQGTGSSYFGSQNVLPKAKYYSNLGSLQYKWLTLHAAELWVETLVAQETIATIGGRILVGPTTALTADLAAGDSTIHVKHNQMVYGDIAYMEANGKVEFIWINSSYSGSAGDYTYSVVRNLDGTGANDWYKGDAMFNTGQTGIGFIDIYSVRGVKSASQTGPTIVGNVRNSANYNDWSEGWAIGNLNNLYGYNTNIYGVGLGKYANSSSFVTIDSTNGIRLRYKDSGGNIYDRITLSMGGVVTIAGYIPSSGAASDINNNTTTISGGKITTNTITLNQLNFTPVQTSNVVASINSSSEGITINGGKLTINSSTTFASGYDPTGKIASGGAASDINNNTTTISGGKITTSSITADKLSVTDLYAIGATIGGWTIGSTSINKTVSSGDYYTSTSLSSTLSGYATGLSIVTQKFNYTSGQLENKIIVSSGGYNDGGASRYGFSIWDSVTSAWLMNVGYGGTGNSMVAKIAGLSFDTGKIYVGTTSAGLALNTSSTRWLANSGSGFEVWNPTDTRLICGTLSSSGTLASGFAWNLNDTADYNLKLRVAGEIVSSKFSTVSTLDSTESFTGTMIVDNYVTTKNGSTNSSFGINSEGLIGRYNQENAKSIIVTLSSTARKIMIDNTYNMPKFLGVLASAPSINLQAGDYFLGVSNYALNIYDGSAWHNYNVN